MRPGTSFGWHWNYDGEPCGSISLATKDTSMQFWYTRTPSGGEPQRMVYEVQIERTPCHFGGSRPWFRCPRCFRRCAVLYGLARDGRFGCRACMRLAYQSEAEDNLSRLWRKQRKLEAKIGENYERPKGMRQRTYELICARIEAVEEAKDADFWAGAAVLARRLGMTMEDLLK